MLRSVTNEFPPIWFDTFLSPRTAAAVDRELAFIQRHLPVAEYPRLLDLPCGIGRHAGPLAKLGYDVVGGDRSETALATARDQYPEVDFRSMDLCELSAVDSTFDAVLCLWQSFGYGTPQDNRRVLRDMRHMIPPGGRILLDIYNADAARRLPLAASEDRGGRIVHTRRSWHGQRLRVDLEYSDSDQFDRHEWQLYTPAEMRELAAEVGLSVIVCCARFDADTPASIEHLRMQLLFEPSE